MAGIGFRLKKMLSEETFTGLIKGYLFSTVMSSGPWLISVVCLSLLGILSAATIGSSDMDLFGVTVVYVYVGTLMLTGIFQPLITRLMADELYSRNRENIASMFVSVICFTVLLLFIVGFLFIAFAPLPGHYKLSAVILFVVVGCIWQLMIFLSASSDYKTITGGFLMGSVLGVAAGFWGGHFFGLAGYLNGFILGQSFIFFILCYKVMEDYKVVISFNWNFLTSMKFFPELAFIGALSYLGTWVDKFIFWWGGTGKQITYLFYVYPEYDASMFLAFLTTVPAMAHFLIVIETNFYIKYKKYYDTITKKAPLHVIEEKKRDIVTNLIDSFYNLCKIQIFITLVVIYFAPQILGLLNFPLEHISIFQTAVWGVSFYSLIMMICIVLLYFDLRKPVLFIYVSLVVLNAVFTVITLFLGKSWHGVGYSSACLVTAVIAFFVLVYHLKNLEYITFINQPVAGEVKGSGNLYHIKLGKVE